MAHLLEALACLLNLLLGALDLVAALAHARGELTVLEAENRHKLADNVGHGDSLRRERLVSELALAPSLSFSLLFSLLVALVLCFLLCGSTGKGSGDIAQGHLPNLGRSAAVAPCDEVVDVPVWECAGLSS